jgi:hypothetical protein
MNPALWNALCDKVADMMKVHTRPFVTPLVQDVTGMPPAIGTGTFIYHANMKKILTCEHVANSQPHEHEFHGHQCLLKLPVSWHMDATKDAAVATVPTSHWNSVSHNASPLPLSRFDRKHEPVEGEVLFFRGFAGQNATLQIGWSSLIATGYCSQEKQGSGDNNIFEILWNPQGTTVSTGTSQEVRSKFQYNNPGGFSGSLVWNTRFVEKGCDLSTWSPQDALVTGLLRRWDFNTKTLLAWRVQHLLAWL